MKYLIIVAVLLSGCIVENEKFELPASELILGKFCEESVKDPFCYEFSDSTVFFTIPSIGFENFYEYEIKADTLLFYKNNMISEKFKFKVDQQKFISYNYFDEKVFFRLK